MARERPAAVTLELLETEDRGYAIPAPSHVIAWGGAPDCDEHVGAVVESLTRWAS